MLSLSALLLFTITTFIVVLSPGPAAIGVAVEGASTKYKRAIFMILGIAFANIVFFALSATGIAALMITTTHLFFIIKWIGILYLMYLGIGAIFNISGGLKIRANNSIEESLYVIFCKGFILEITNPKALLYFAALLPQFIDPLNPIIPQLTVMCAITVVLDLIGYSMYFSLGSKIRKNNIPPRMINVINRLAGSVLVITGGKMAFIDLL
ncbi:homoserine/homoserine lactone efflux protein [Bathymodiolus platifrons methanotrophic gill symbiont]|uniref:LysE family translocator n=1 Tax=Bathymodiolus platifrons methanotrophic gill symbiont TaxID=113268 RepID=UPI000B41D812|nr:LysE family translocator [Bathymodiolus platifrons methanotrophic gill symbiont]GAW87472.1 homoserine/homoserine lactone efflux protein [Bathymodiolus platifrons methanotrophic gill symbiont]GFO74910.1 homoserine/homoserine lactone efflux protein [Bathymodiolus platifrons methanotrophic gill symbiont]